MKVSGHTQYTTFARYVNPNTQTVRNIADALTNYHFNANLNAETEQSQFLN